MYWDELQREEYEYEEDDQAFTDFQKYAYDKKNIDIIFKTDRTDWSYGKISNSNVCMCIARKGTDVCRNSV